MTTRVPFTDRLRDRGFVDQWGFLFFAIVGFAGIFSAKALKAEANWVLIGAIASMLLYALLIGRSGTGRLRSDQAGDNCYYLGLIYTLASLSYSIATFDPDNPAATIVQGFGIALVTTILGLILRVVFSQGRPDMENVEEQARMELTAATSQLKRELTSVIRQVNDLGRQVDQSIREVQEAATKSIQEFATVSVQGIQDVTATASQAIRDEANDFAARSKRYTTTFDNLLSKLDDHSEKVQHLSEAHDALVTTARLSAETATFVAAAVDGMSQSAARAASAVSSVEAGSSAAAKIMQELQSSNALFEQMLRTIRSETERQLKDLQSAPGEAVRQSMESMQEAAAQLRMQVEELTRSYGEARQFLADQGVAAVETAKRHNDDLENELKRSTALVGRVHSALADMTRTLAETLERG